MEKIQHPRHLLTVKQFSAEFPAFSEASLRNLIFLAKPRISSKGTLAGNGFDTAMVRIGRKILIDERKFFEWVDSNQNGGCHA